MNIKIMLWKIGFLPVGKCPICGNKTLGHGFTTDPKIAKYYTCMKEECKFNLGW